MAYIVEQAGGKAMAKEGLKILDIKPTHIHQRAPTYLGSSEDVDEIVQFLAKADKGDH
ncbi:Fructose-16-bisphosphatase clas 1 [Taenia solium]|eukprot:TsM_000908600 transcript=TsM_000908600 gene=TsM_000908600